MPLRKITDKDLIVFLVAKGFEIKDIKKERGKNRSLVYFSNCKELESAILAFVNKTEEVNIGDYQSAERRVKTLLYLQKKH